MFSLNKHCRFADLEGNNIHELANDDSVHRIAHPFSIAVFDEWVYWTEWNIKKVYRAHKLTGLSEMELVTTIHRPFDINIYHSLKQDTSKYSSSVVGHHTHTLFH